MPFSSFYSVYRIHANVCSLASKLYVHRLLEDLLLLFSFKVYVFNLEGEGQG